MPGTGHFHIYVDVPKAEQQGEGEAIPFDDAHKHYGKGQTAADLELSSVSTAVCYASITWQHHNASTAVKHTLPLPCRLAAVLAAVLAPISLTILHAWPFPCTHVLCSCAPAPATVYVCLLRLRVLVLFVFVLTGQAHTDTAVCQCPSRILRPQVELQHQRQRQVMWLLCDSTQNATHMHAIQCAHLAAVAAGIAVACSAGHRSSPRPLVALCERMQFVTCFSVFLVLSALLLNCHGSRMSLTWLFAL